MSSKGFQVWVHRWMARATETDHVFMIVAAVLIGVVAGFGAIGIRMAISFVSKLSFGFEGDLLSNLQAAPWYWVILVPAMGGLIVGPIIHYLSPEARGTGVPEVMQSVLVKGGVIRPRVALIKALASSITIGTGGSVGREGPIVQIGSSIGSTVAQFFQVSGTRMKTLVGCGAAAGIAAAFNAPVAGALFAVEIILMDFAVAQFSPIVISSVVATVISHKFEGNFAAFKVPHYEIVSYSEIMLYGVMGLLCGLASFLFIKVIYNLDGLLKARLQAPIWLMPAIGGALVGTVGIFFPQIMGVGYESINLALHGDMLLWLSLALVFVKMVTTATTLGFGGSGGVFAPSLFVGGMLGSAFGIAVGEIWPGSTAGPGAYALVAMGGIVAGTTRAPITAILTIFELTYQYDIILPLMLTCILSTLLSAKLNRESIYSMKLVQRKLKVRQGLELNIMKTIHVKSIYSEEVATLLESAHFKELVKVAMNEKSPYIAVVDKQGHLTGMVSFGDIKKYIYEQDILTDMIIAKDVAITKLKLVELGDDCQRALELMEGTDLLGLPVVEGGKLKGMIWQKDILNAYHREILRRDIASTLVDRIHNTETGAMVTLEGMAVAEIPLPKSFLGKSLIELNLRATHDVLALSVKHWKQGEIQVHAFPGPDYRFESEDDRLVIAGTKKAVERLRQLW